MSRAEVEVTLGQGLLSLPTATTDDGTDQSSATRYTSVGRSPEILQGIGGVRRTPRKSVIVVLPDNHFVSPEQVSDRLPPEGDSEQVDVILACAGQPTGIAALQRKIRDLQVLLAPAGTSTQDLRELAMRRAPGDIVTLFSGTPV